uniref:Immunoglobulin domain-containing protein n=1 Tax=Scleropages formosus TaxID=113540 RepID=A0A8C9UXD1_SCLFO
ILTLQCVFSTGVSCSHLDRRFEETVLRTVQPGDNVTLCCDVKNEQKIIWYRQCSHENQPPWEISSYDITGNPVPRYSFIWNYASESFDLQIKNITESDLGIFYCECHRFGNITTRLNCYRGYCACLFIFFIDYLIFFKVREVKE